MTLGMVENTVIAQKLGSSSRGFNLLYPLSDCDKTYAKSFAQSQVLQGKRHLRHIVRTIGMIDRHFSVTLRKTYLLAHQVSSTQRKDKAAQVEEETAQPMHSFY